MSLTIIQEIIRQFVGKRCYLNGAPATVTQGDGIAIIQPDDKAIECAWVSWHLVNSRMRRDSYFVTLA